MKDYIELITVLISSTFTIWGLVSEKNKNKKLKVEAERRYTNTQNQNFSAISTSGDNSNIDISATQTILNMPYKILEKQLKDISNENLKKDCSDFRTSTRIFFTFLFFISFGFSYFLNKDIIPFNLKYFFVLSIYIVSLLFSFLSIGLIFKRIYQQFSIQKFKFSFSEYSTTIEKFIRFFQFYISPIVYSIFQYSLISLLLDFDVTKNLNLNYKLFWTLIYLVGNIYYYYFFSFQILTLNEFKYRFIVNRLMILITLTIGILFTTQNNYFLSLVDVIFQIMQPK